MLLRYKLNMNFNVFLITSNCVKIVQNSVEVKKKKNSNVKRVLKHLLQIHLFKTAFEYLTIN